MKVIAVFGFVLVLAFAASVSACPGNCPPHRSPVCGFDGMCLYNFNNGCEMIRYNCQRGGFFRNSSPYQCQQAENGRSAYMYCRHINGF